MTTLMVMNLKRASILTSFNHHLFHHARFQRAFLFKDSPAGELSFNIKKNPALQDSPPAADRFSDIFPLRRSAIPPGGLFVI